MPQLPQHALRQAPSRTASHRLYNAGLRRRDVLLRRRIPKGGRNSRSREWSAADNHTLCRTRRASTKRQPPYGIPCPVNLPLIFLFTPRQASCGPKDGAGQYHRVPHRRAGCRPGYGRVGVRAREPNGGRRHPRREAGRDSNSNGSAGAGRCARIAQMRDGGRDGAPL